MSSTVITSDMLNRIIKENEDITKRCDKLMDELNDSKLMARYNSVIIDNSSTNMFQILPKNDSSKESHLKPDFKIGSKENIFSRINFNDVFLIEDNNAYIKQSPLNENCESIDALNTQKILDVIESLNIKVTSNEDLVLEDPYHFMSLSSRKDIFFNQTKFMISMLVYVKSLDSRLLSNEIKSKNGTTSDSENEVALKNELIELTEQFESVIRGFDTKIKNNNVSISKLNSVFSNCNDKVDQLWDSIVKEVQKANKTFENQKLELKTEISTFKESKQKYDTFQTCTEDNISCMQERLSESEDSIKNMVNQNCEKDSKMSNVESSLKEFEEKLKLLNSIVIDHSKRVSMIDNIDKVIQNNFNEMNSYIQHNNEEVDSKFSKFNENTSNEIINLVTKIGEINMDLSHHKKSTNKNVDDISTKISQLVQKINEVDTHQKHAVISTNNRFSEMTENFRQHLQNTTESVSSSYKHIDNLNSEVKKNNQEMSIEMARKIDDLVNKNVGQTQLINKLTNNLQTKDHEIETLNTNISLLKKQFAELKNTVERQYLDVGSFTSLRSFQKQERADSSSEIGSVSEKSISFSTNKKTNTKMVSSHRTGEPVSFLKTSFTEKPKNVLNIDTDSKDTSEINKIAPKPAEASEPTLASEPAPTPAPKPTPTPAPKPTPTPAPKPTPSPAPKAVGTTETKKSSGGSVDKLTTKAVKNLSQSQTKVQEKDAMSETNSEASSTSIRRTRVYVKKKPEKS